MVHTDHRPLVAVFKKPLLNAPKRLQRILLGLQKYTLEVKYIAGSQMYIADFLSRSPMTEKRKHHEQVSVF